MKPQPGWPGAGLGGKPGAGAGGRPVLREMRAGGRPGLGGMRAGLAAAGLAAALLGCSGDGEGVDVNGYAPEGAVRAMPAAGSARADSLFAQIQATIFSAICTECHVGGNAPMGLQLSPGASADMVGRPSEERPDLLLIEPGDPDNSYLVHKIEGRAGIVGRRMPRDLPPLSEERMALVRSWVAALGIGGEALEAGGPGGTAKDTSAGGDSVPKDTLVPGSPEALFREARTLVFGPICSQCHIGDDPPKGLLLNGENPKLAIGRPSDEEDDILLIKPGDPDNSYLVWKIEGREEINGKRMPRDLPPLSARQIQAVRAWIASLE